MRHVTTNRRIAPLALFLVLALLVGCARSSPPSPTLPATATTLPESNGNRPPDATPQSAGNDEAAAQVKQADALLVKGDNQAATELLIRTVGANPDYAPAWDLLTYALTRLEQYPAAASVGLRAVALAPQSATARFNAGLAEAKSGAYARAIVNLEQVVALNPSQLAPLYYLGAVYEGAGKRELAAATYQKGLAAFPGDQDLKVALAAVSGDLNMDGKPEHVSVEPDVVVVQDGATGAELLRYPYKMAAMSTMIGAIGGAFPALVVTDRGSKANWVYAWDGKVLNKLGLVRGENEHINPVFRTLETLIVYRAKGTSDAEYLTYATDWIEDGKLQQQVKQSTEPVKGSVTLPHSIVELFVALSANRGDASATEALTKDVVAHAGEARGQPFAMYLLVQPSGTYRLAVTVGGKTVATATATLSKGDAVQITQLQWD